MHTQDDAAAMAFAVLRNRGYRFLAVSPEGVVVANGSPTLAIDVSRPVKPEPLTSGSVNGTHRKTSKRRRMKFGFVAEATGYPDIMKAMSPADKHVFPLVAGTTIQHQAMTLANAAHRYWGKGSFSVTSSPEGITVIRK